MGTLKENMKTTKMYVTKTCCGERDIIVKDSIARRSAKQQNEQKMKRSLTKAKVT